MEYDDAAWERSDNVFDDFKKKVVRPDVLLAVTDFMASHRDSVRPVDRAWIAELGTFNLCFRMVFEDGLFLSPTLSMSRPRDVSRGIGPQ